MRTLALIALLLVPPAAAFAAPTPVQASSRIDAVTVYRTGARVTRVARVDLPAGASRVLLAGLPDQLEDDAIRVSGAGAARARLHGVEVERVTAEAAADAEARGLAERIEALEDEDRALGDRIAAAQQRARFVESLRSTYGEERAKNLAVRPVAAREWAELTGFVVRELEEAQRELRASEAARRSVARRMTQARADAAKVAAKRGVTTKTVAVEVEAERAGSFELRVTYAVPSAGWKPVWDARLEPEVSRMELAFGGAVWQSSGEDWPEVTLAVSTAQPAVGLYVPVLEPVWLTRHEPSPPPRPSRSHRKAAAEAPAPASVALDYGEVGGVAGSVPQVEAETAVAHVEQGLLAATFTAPRRERVDGSGRARRIALARFPLAATVARTAAPRLEAAAFLTAKATNETGFPLLPGDATVYVGDELAGRVTLPFTPAGGELELAFGRDDRIEVDRKVLDRTRETAGLLAKEGVTRYRVRIAVKNRYAAPVSVKLLDLVPVSRDEKIVVEVLDGTTAATREDPERPGVRVHELALGAREERVVELRYLVRAPRHVTIAGLE